MEITIRHRKFTVNPGQSAAAWAHINRGTWEPDTFDILDRFVQPGEVVLDLGSWSGVISLYIADKASRVFAVDPDPVCFAELTKNIACNPDVAQKVKALQVAVSDQHETLHLSARAQYGQSSSSILQRARDAERSHALTTLPLADLVKQEGINRLDFIKMDIEGAEFRVLPTLAGLLEELGRPTLLVSFHHTFLVEHHYARRLRSPLLNKVALKLHQWFGLRLFRHAVNHTLRDSLRGLQAYTHVYTTAGQPVTHAFLQKNPSFIRDHDLVFTDRPWDAG